MTNRVVIAPKPSLKEKGEFWSTSLSLTQYKFSEESKSSLWSEEHISAWATAHGSPAQGFIKLERTHGWQGSRVPVIGPQFQHLNVPSTETRSEAPEAETGSWSDYLAWFLARGMETCSQGSSACSPGSPPSGFPGSHAPSCSVPSRTLTTATCQGSSWNLHSPFWSRKALCLSSLVILNHRKSTHIFYISVLSVI